MAMNGTVSQGAWQVKAATCELLAFSLRYPDQDMVQVLISGEWAAAVRELAEAGAWAGSGADVELDVSLDALDRLLGNSQGEGGEERVLRALRQEATRLFHGVPEPPVSPFEGVWRAREEGVEPLLFVNPHSMEVERFAKQCGVTRPQGVNEPLDHIVAELELLGYLASVAAGAAVPEGGVPAERMPGGGAAEAYGRFVDEHVNQWVPRFADQLEAQAGHPFYQVVARMLRAL